MQIFATTININDLFRFLFIHWEQEWNISLLVIIVLNRHENYRFERRPENAENVSKQK